MPSIRKTPGEKVTDLFIYLSMWLVIAVTLYPFIYVLSMSVSAPRYVIDQSVWLWPKGFSLGAYKKVFENPDVFRSYYNTIFYTVTGTCLNVVMTMLAAYPLSRRGFMFRKPIMIYVTVTMFFGGGLIPTFLLIQELGLYNTRWAMILPTAVSTFLIIIARSFLQSIPEALHESAKIDGANDFTILMRVIIPLSMPIIAVLTLFYAVNHWNSYFNALIYLPDAKLQPLQLFLVKVLVQNQVKGLGGVLDQGDRAMLAIQLKYSLIIVAILPILVIYPFLQKYFVKGVMIGSLKE
jgi:putative aldouronate transport system permease protein